MDVLVLGHIYDFGIDCETAPKIPLFPILLVACSMNPVLVFLNPGAMCGLMVAKVWLLTQVRAQYKYPLLAAWWYSSVVV